MALPESCPICEAPVGRHQLSDYWLCDNGHTIYRGSESKPPRYELRSTTSDNEPGGTHDVWDLLTDEPFYDPVADDYAYGLTESRARSLLDRLLAT